MKSQYKRLSHSVWLCKYHIVFCPKYRYWGRHLWARGYCVSTVGLNEEQLRKYVKWQQEREPKGQLLSLMPSRLVFMPPPLAVVSDYIKIILRIIL